MKKRPIGVIIYGALLMLGPIAILNFVHRSPTAEQIDLAFLVVMFMALITGIGLLMLKSWARWLMLVGTGLYLLWLPIAVGTGGEDLAHIGSWLGIVLPLGWCGSIFWYFLRPSVKAQFSTKSE